MIEYALIKVTNIWFRLHREAWSSSENGETALFQICICNVCMNKEVGGEAENNKWYEFRSRTLINTKEKLFAKDILILLLNGIK